MTQEFHTANFGVGIFAASGAGTIPLMYVPKNGGAITLVKVHLLNSVTATGTINAPVIISMADASTPTMAGTLGTAALWTVTGAGGSRTAVTLTTDYIQPGTADKWLGLSYTSGTVLAGAPVVQVTYLMGR
jgi:hypothetical protein